MGMLVTNSLTNSLTHSCLVNLIDVTLACEDANSKLVDVVTVADDDLVGNNLLQIWKLSLVIKLNFCHFRGLVIKLNFLKLRLLLRL